MVVKMITYQAKKIFMKGLNKYVIKNWSSYGWRK